MKSTHPLIGLIGRAQSGEDTAAGFLQERGYVRHAFADPLREAALGLDPIVDATILWNDPSFGDATHLETKRLSDVVRLLGWDRAKVLYPEVRRTLQRLGTESVRALDETFWIRALEARLDAAETPVVVTDVRFPNEAEAIAARGGWIVRVVRPGAPEVLEHASESALDLYPADVEIRNASTLEAFREEVLRTEYLVRLYDGSHAS